MVRDWGLRLGLGITDWGLEIFNLGGRWISGIGDDNFIIHKFISYKFISCKLPYLVPG